MKNKNIWLLPTNESSRIYLIKKNNRLGITSKNPEFMENFGGGTQNQYVYITSDDYIGLSYYLDGNLVRKGVVDDKAYWESRKDYKKIILTTDPKLIKEGVQPIPDCFLEWLVSNPNCDFVETEKVQDGKFVDFEADSNVTEGVYENYRIIIKELHILKYPDNHLTKERLIDLENLSDEEKHESLAYFINSIGDYFVLFFKALGLKTHIESEISNEKENYKLIFQTKEHYLKQKMFTEEQVELITKEMVNWALDNIGNPDAKSGKKFDEVISKYKNNNEQ